MISQEEEEWQEQEKEKLPQIAKNPEPSTPNCEPKALDLVEAFKYIGG